MFWISEVLWVTS